MAVQTAPDGTTHDEWRGWWNEHPLRKWRKATGESLGRTAQELGCSVTMLQWYEHGVHPLPESKVSLAAEMMGIQPDTLKRKLRQHRAEDPRK